MRGRVLRAYDVGDRNVRIIWTEADTKHKFFTCQQPSSHRSKFVIHIAQPKGEVRWTMRDGRIVDVRFFPHYHCSFKHAQEPIPIAEDDLDKWDRMFCLNCLDGARQGRMRHG